jgi:hypothetical protein
VPTTTPPTSQPLQFHDLTPIIVTNHQCLNLFDAFFSKGKNISNKLFVTYMTSLGMHEEIYKDDMNKLDLAKDPQDEVPT